MDIMKVLLHAHLREANKNPDVAQELYLGISELLKQGKPLPEEKSRWLGETLQELALCDATDRSEVRRILHLSKPSRRPEKTSTLSLGSDIARIEFKHGCTTDKAIEILSEKAGGKDPKEAIRKEFYNNKKNHQKHRKMTKACLEEMTPYHQTMKALFSVLAQIAANKK